MKRSKKAFKKTTEAYAKEQAQAIMAPAVKKKASKPKKAKAKKAY